MCLQQAATAHERRRTGRNRGLVGLSCTASGCSQDTLRPRAVGSDMRVDAKMTGMTPVAFTCTANAAFVLLQRQYAA